MKQVASFRVLNFGINLQSSTAQPRFLCHTRHLRRRRRDRIAKFTMVVPGNVAAAAGRGDLAVVQSWLKNAGVGAVNDVCADGSTCLLRFLSSRCEDVELARFLISHGADVNVCDPFNWTPLHLACFQRTGSAEMVSLLLHAGAGSTLEARTPRSGPAVYPDSTEKCCKK